MAAMSASFWWDRAGRAPIGVPGLEAVIFSIDGVLDDARADHDLFAQLVWDLHCAGIRVAVATARRGLAVHRSVRELLGDGAVEAVITGDDVDSPGGIYQHALWELGVSAEHALAVEDSGLGLRAALGAGLATVVVTTERTRSHDFTGAVAVFAGYDGPESLSVHHCRRLREHRMVAQRSAALSA
ncbi:MAG: HAD family hydrolase [Mycobacterium sp.]|nr:HAD family hydrolase [Mycobacterium sp.]